MLFFVLLYFNMFYYIFFDTFALIMFHLKTYAYGYFG